MIRLSYLSQNIIAKATLRMKDEVNAILLTSQKRNAQADITGVLVFNRGVFGQILEGPAGAVEETFERIQLDARHCDVRLLEVRPIQERSFATWSMGYCGHEALLDRMFGNSHRLDMTELDADAMFGLLRRLALAHELHGSAA